jgi:hypothetical protein
MSAQNPCCGVFAERVETVDAPQTAIVLTSLARSDESVDSLRKECCLAIGLHNFATRPQARNGKVSVEPCRALC